MKIPAFKFAGLKTKSKILLGICSPMVLLVALGGVSVYSITSIVDTNKQIDHTHVVLGEAAAIVSSAIDMETGMRGYLLAGQDGFLDPYRGGQEATYAGIAELQKTIDDNPAQVERLGEAERILREWQEKVTEPTIHLRRDIGDAETMNDMAALVGEARGKKYFDAFRAIMAEFAAEENGLMVTRQANNEETVGTTFFIIAICVAAALVIGLLPAWWIGNGIANPIKSMTEAMQKLASGDTSEEIPAKGRTDEIGEMADAVQVFKDNIIKADALAAEQQMEQAEKEKRAQRIETLTGDFDRSAMEMLKTVSDAASDMEATAQSMSKTAEETGRQATAAAAGVEQASSNVQTVAASSEELASTITEVARQVAESARASSDLTRSFDRVLLSRG